MSVETQATLGEFELQEDVSLSPDQRQRLAEELRHTARRLYWSVYDRGETVCATCGADEPLEVHHRDSDPFNNHLINLVAVCHTCHVHGHKRKRTSERLETWKSALEEM